MSGETLMVLKAVGVVIAVLGFGYWQLRELDRDRKALQSKRSGNANDASADQD